MLACPEVIPSTSIVSPARLRWCSPVASASALDSLNYAVSGASSGRGEGRTIKDAPLARETVKQVDDFADQVKAKRVELEQNPVNCRVPYFKGEVCPVRYLLTCVPVS